MDCGESGCGIFESVCCIPDIKSMAAAVCRGISSVMMVNNEGVD
jgi:hypothetical protein